MRLLDQTRQQLASADGRHLLDRGVSQMVKSLCQSLDRELYAPNGLEGPLSRRLVDCLPEFNRWAKGVWEGIPDSGVEVSLFGYFLVTKLIVRDWCHCQSTRVTQRLSSEIGREKRLDSQLNQCCTLYPLHNLMHINIQEYITRLRQGC
jgi:hypothetical protein